MEGQHDVEDVKGEVSGSTVRASGADGGGHVGESEPTADVMLVCVWDFLPFGGSLFLEGNGTVESVGVGNGKGGLRSVNLDAGELGSPFRIEAEGGCCENAILVGDGSGEMSGNLNFDDETTLLLAGGDTLREGDFGHS